MAQWRASFQNCWSLGVNVLIQKPINIEKVIMIIIHIFIKWSFKCTCCQTKVFIKVFKKCAIMKNISKNYSSQRSPFSNAFNRSDAPRGPQEDENQMSKLGCFYKRYSPNTKFVLFGYFIWGSPEALQARQNPKKGVFPGLLNKSWEFRGSA